MLSVFSDDGDFEVRNDVGMELHLHGELTDAFDGLFQAHLAPGIRATANVVPRPQPARRRRGSGVGRSRGGMRHFGRDEAGEGDDHLLPLGGEAPGILQRELRLLDDLVQLCDEVVLVHFPTRCEDAGAR